MTAVLIDIGGVLVPDYLTAAASAWGDRLGIAPDGFLAARFAGNDDQILIGRAGEAAWWPIVADRLQADEGLVAAIRADLVARRTWDTALLAGLRRIRGRATITIVSNGASQWSQQRSPFHALRPSRTAAPATSPATGSAHDQPNSAFEASPTSRPPTALCTAASAGSRPPPSPSRWRVRPAAARTTAPA